MSSTNRFESFLRHDRKQACVECPFRPGGCVGAIGVEKFLMFIDSGMPSFPCHMTHAHFEDGRIVFHDKVLPFQQCAGYFAFARNIDREPEHWTEAGRDHYATVSGDGVFRTIAEFREHYQE